MPDCTRCGQDNPDAARFCLACGAPLAAPEAPAEERKLVTVVFTDIVGSTAKAEQLDPEDVRARLSPYYAHVRERLVRHGGTVEKFIGDAVVALFGAPVAHEDDPERAVRAALAVRDAVQELNAQDDWLDLRIRVGVHTGEALVVLGARATEGEGMAAGDVMNTAARIQSAAPVDGILVGDATYRATRDAIDYRPADPVAAKGKSEPVVVWEAVGIHVAEPRHAPRSALVAREAELERLRGLWDEVRRELRPRVVTVVGAPGIGKTRLLEEVAAHVEQEGAVHWGRCLPYGEGITYWPVREVLRDAAGIRHSDDGARVAAKLDALLQQLEGAPADELRTMAAAAAHLLGATTTPRGTYSAAEITQAELHWGLRRIFHRLARRRPLALVFEDLHWAEPTLIELVRELGAEQTEAPLLVVGSGRPELADAAPRLMEDAIMLEPLPSWAGEALLGDLVGADAPPEAVAALVRNAGGNPLFLEETVRMLRETGKLDGDGWQTIAEAEALPVPTSLQALIASRLDQLPAAEKRVVQHASVAGAAFWPGAVAHLLEGDADLASLLTELERRDLVRRREASSVGGEHEYVFKHALIRDVAYGQLPKARRVVLHVRFSDWVRDLPGPEDELVEIRGWHLEQACRLAAAVARSPIPAPTLEAAQTLGRAAEKAERREGIREAGRFYERALALLDGEYPETALELRLRYGRTVGQLGELRRARDDLAAGAEEAARLERGDLRCQALVALGNIAQRLGRPSEARDWLDEARMLADEVGDKGLQIRVAFSLATLDADYHGRVESAVADLQRATADAEQIEDRALSVEGHLRLGFLLYNMGSLAAAEAELASCIESARELGSHRDEARAVFALGVVTYYRGDRHRAEHLNLQAREWLERTRETFFQIQNSRMLGMYALGRDDPVGAERRLQEAIALAIEDGGRLLLETYRYLAEALVRMGRVDDARRLTDLMTRDAAPTEDQAARAYVLLAQALVATAAGSRYEAVAAYREAIALLEAQSLPIEAGESRISLARALRGFGKPAEADEQLERAQTMFEELGATGTVTEIERERAEIASGAGRSDPARSV